MSKLSTGSLRQLQMTIQAALLLALLGGGHAVATAQSGGAFASTGSMTTPRSEHTATLLTNGKVLIAGGTRDYTGLVSTAEIYDPETRIFLPTGAMKSPRRSHTATLLPDGKVLLAGGTILDGPSTTPSNSAEIYDPATGTFTLTGSLAGNHVCQQASLLANGKVLIAGGYDANGGVTQAELYDPAVGTFAATGKYVKDTFDLNSCQGAATSLLPDGKVLFIWQDGGAELYDPGTGSFAATGSPLTPGSNNGLPAATLLMSGDVLVAGGANDSGFFSSAGLYSLSTETFAATGNIGTGRANHTATLLPDGQVLVAGSYVFGNASLAEAELYDPAVGAFTALRSMATTRSLHSATLLPDGSVLIAGGSTSGLATSLAEVYIPSQLVASPRLFSGGVWRDSTGEFASASTPAVAGDVLSMYTTGLAAGGLIPPQVAIGGRLADVLFFGAAPGYPGYNQVNFRVPGEVVAGPAVAVRLSYIGRSSNQVKIGVR